MRRFACVALLASPLIASIACGSDSKKSRDGGEAGAAGEGGDTGTGGDAGAGKGGSQGGAGRGGAGGTSGGGESGSGGDAGSGEGGSGGSGDDEVELTVVTTAEVRPISPLIYGVNVAQGVTCANSSARFTLCRLGGNPWSTYNWENNASNAGNDSNLCSENNAALGASDVPAATVTSMVTEAGANAASAVVTIPMLAYVAADKVSGMPFPLCSGDVRQSADYLNTRMKQNRARKGAAFADPPVVSDAIVSQDEFLAYLRTRAGDTNVLITLDNQPELWGQTHVAVHPDLTTYQEVVARNTEYAAMVRDNWPEAEITGYGGYGYQAFLNLQNAPNRPSESQFIDYYLAAMSAASTTAGRRLIDYLDVHWYSVVEDTRAARVQAPRSLWDPSYVEGSWIGENHGAIRLIPWLTEKIDSHYPDTKLAISSWAYGGVDEISGAIAVADALGIFGREGVSLAALQPQEGDNTFNVGAFAVFRNYDGDGASFGDQSVRATSSDVARVSVYASTDSTEDERVVVVAINRGTEAAPVRLDIQDATSFSDADVYVLAGSSPELQIADSLTATGENIFVTTLPGSSVSVIVPRP